MAEGEDRTQAASERRLQRARDEGQAPLSREVVAAAGLGAAVLVLSMGGGAIVRPFVGRLQEMLTGMAGATVDRAMGQAGMALLAGAAPMLLAGAVAGGAAVLLQTGFLVHVTGLAPDIGRVDPRRGLKRLFGVDNAATAVKAVVKLGVLVWAVWSAMAGLVPEAARSLTWTPGTLVERFGQALLGLMLTVLGAQTMIALLDVGWMRWRHGQRLRMSREELRQEQRESEGDPKIKARLRQLRQARGRRRMLAAVAKATVVVTNPTHFAVALAYERGRQAAPRVVAKGMDEVAARIRAEAGKRGVPLVADPPLARALYAVSLDAEVPAENFQAVAAIIAYVWKLKER